MRCVLIAIGSILASLFIVQLERGRKYVSLIQALDDDNFPLHQLYIVGFAWKELMPFHRKIVYELRAYASLLYEPQYADYYANVVWAQTITLVHLFLTMTFLVAGLLYEVCALMLGTGIFLSVLVAVYCLENMKNTLAKRTEQCEVQLPEIVSTMAVLVNSGMILREAWHMIAENGSGVFYELMQKASDNMKNGYSDADAIFLFGRASNSARIKKFTSALLQSMEKGGAELSGFLVQQSSELWHEKKQTMLQAGERAATKLLLPIMLIFVGVIIIVMTAAFAGSLF